MKRSTKVLALLVLYAAFCSSCNHRKQNPADVATMAERSSLREQYPKIPADALLADTVVYDELKLRYTQYLSALKTATAKDQARLILVTMTPEIGPFATEVNQQGIPYITKTASDLGLDHIDLSPDILQWMSMRAGNAPVEGNWTREGAAFTAGQLAGIISKYDNYRSPVLFPATGKPETFGDLQSREDDVLDGEKNIPYHLTVNAQGLRMSHSLSFPKRKQTILLLGDAKIYNPFLDNEYMITELLQKRFPDKEIVNAGNLQYTMEDYYSLYTEKARYTEPDIVIVCTNGGDITDNYFSQRNRYSRSGKCYRPSAAELRFYEHFVHKN